MIVSPVEPILVTLQQNSSLCFWDLNNYNLINIIKNTNISKMIFSEDGKKILYTDTKKILHIANSVTL